MEYTRVSGEGSRLWREPFVLTCVQGFAEPAESGEQSTDGLAPFFVFVGAKGAIIVNQKPIEL